MKYRIKIVTYKTGRVGYTAQLKTALCWVGIDYKGESDYAPPFGYEDDNRDSALNRIDKHHAGNCKKHTIEFEYINK